MRPAITVICLLSTVAPAAPPGFVTKDGPRLMLDGQEYRAIGVNIPHLHQAYLGTWFHNVQVYGSHEAARQAIIAAVEDCERSGIAFIRFFANPGYPIDISRLYAKDPEAYWRGMDEVFALCRDHGLKLIPSLNTIPGWHHYYGELGQAILDPTTKTHQGVYQYLTEFVTRYKDDPTVLMWELVNEGTLRADVDQEGRNALPKGVYPEGAAVREKGVREDSLTWAMFQQLYRDQTAFIKAIDPNHLVTSGDAHVRPECTSRRETFPDFRFRQDTWREWLANNLLAQAEPLDVFSYHHYGTYAEPSKPGDRWGFSSVELLRNLIRATHAADAPVLIGELGQNGPKLGEDPSAKWLLECADMLEAERVSLAAVWVWHFAWQPEYTISGASHPELVAKIAAFNGRYAHLSRG